MYTFTSHNRSIVAGHVQTLREVPDDQSGIPKLPGIALGGGAARGISHIGVLKELTRANITFPVVSGTSMGAIVAAAYACDKLDLLESIALSISRDKMIQWADFDWQQGTIKGEIIERMLQGIFGGCTFSDLESQGLTLTIVSCDLQTGRPAFIREGSIVDAVMASIAVPGIFAPVKRHGMTLVDGGIIDNVPVDALCSCKSDLTVAVDVHNPEDIWTRALNMLLSSNQAAQEIRERLTEITEDEGAKIHSRLVKYENLVHYRLTSRSSRDSQKAFNRLYRRHKQDSIESGEGWTAIRSLLAALDIMNWALRTESESPFPLPHILIHPPVRRFHAHQFYLSGMLIGAGQVAGRKAAAELSAIMKPTPSKEQSSS